MSLGGRLHVVESKGGEGEEEPLRNRVLFTTASDAQAARLTNKQPSNRSVQKANTALRREERSANKMWPEDKTCCEKSVKLNEVHCCSAYSDVLVFRLRQYFNSLSDSNQRAFIVERMRTTKNLSDVAEDVDFTHTPLKQIWLEKPDVLHRRISAHQTGKSGVMLPAPCDIDTQYVCTKFFLHIIDRSKNYLYPNANPNHTVDC